MNDAKGGSRSYHPKRNRFAGWSTLQNAGCCGVIEPDLSSTLDKTVCSLFLSYHGTFVMTIISCFSANRKGRAKTPSPSSSYCAASDSGWNLAKLLLFFLIFVDYLAHSFILYFQALDSLLSKNRNVSYTRTFISAIYATLCQYSVFFDKNE
jgi:hypothetical protein